MISKKKKILIFFLIVIFTVLIRIIGVPNEQYVDTFVVHQYANSINRYHYLNWVFNPLSLTGYFPFAFPSLTPLIYSISALMGGIEIRISVLILSLLFTLSIIAFTYLVLKNIFSNFLLIIFGVFFMTSSMFFIIMTQWQLSSRIPSMLFTIVFLYFYLNLIKSRRKKYFFMLCLIGGLMVITHRSFIFLMPFIILPTVIIFLLNKIELKYSWFREILYYFYIFTISLVFILPLLGLDIVNMLGLRISYWVSHKYDAIPFIGTFLTFIFDYIQNTNPLIIFAFIGIIYITFKRKKTQIEKLLIWSIICASPILFDREYFLLAYLIFFAILTVIGFIFCLEQLNRFTSVQIKNVIILIIIITSIFHTSWFYYRNLRPLKNQLGYFDWIDDQTLSTANFLNYNIDSNNKILFNDQFLKFRIKSFSNIYSVDYIDLLKEDKYRNEITFVPSLSMRMYKSGFFSTKSIIKLENKREVLTDYNFYEYWSFMGSSEERYTLWDFFNISYLVENKNFKGSYDVDNSFKYDFTKDYPIIYDNGLMSIYILK
jgi:hypothetical protein